MVYFDSGSAQFNESFSNNASYQISTGSYSPKIRHQDILWEIISKLKPMDFREKIHVDIGDKIGKSHKMIAVADEINKTAEDLRWYLGIYAGKVYSYNGRFWKEIPEAWLLDFLGVSAEKLGVKKHEAKYYVFRENLLKQFISSGNNFNPERSENVVLINLLNGTFEISGNERVLREFRKEDGLTYQLQFECNSVADAPVFKQYLNTVLPDTSLQMVLSEFAGYIFINNNFLKLEKALVLFGDGNNGKSVFFDIMMALLGPENTSNYTLQSVTDSKGYHRAELANKLLNYSSEITSKMNVDVFKQMASGEPVEARLPYSPPFIMRSYGKLLFNTNVLPHDTQDTDGYFRRFLIIPFEVSIPKEKCDPELAKKIIRDELPRVFNWALEGLQRLLLNKKFTESEAVDKVLMEFRKDSDSVQLFLEDENYVQDSDEFISLKNLLLYYQDYCRASGYKPLARNVFTKKMEKLGHIKIRRSEGFGFNLKKNIVCENGTLSTRTTFLD